MDQSFNSYKLPGGKRVNKTAFRLQTVGLRLCATRQWPIYGAMWCGRVCGVTEGKSGKKNIFVVIWGEQGWWLVGVTRKFVRSCSILPLGLIVDYNCEHWRLCLKNWSGVNKKRLTTYASTSCLMVPLYFTIHNFICKFCWLCVELAMGSSNHIYIDFYHFLNIVQI